MNESSVGQQSKSVTEHKTPQQQAKSQCNIFVKIEPEQKATKAPKK